MLKTDGVQNQKIDCLVTPHTLLEQMPISFSVSENVKLSRNKIENILIGKDSRLLIIIGPCSIHDVNAALDYAHRLSELRARYKDRLEIVMRTYFEKPRTVVGWKGLIYDPALDGSCQINYGLILARRLLLDINKLGLPTATEFLDIVTSHYVSDIISWGAIGARTTESQIHREMASAFLFPVGFKNGTDGNLSIAVDAIRSARTSHMFLSPDKQGKITIYKTQGNPYGHMILRGGTNPNYHQNNIKAACKLLKKFFLPPYLVVDFSHGNSYKQYHQQINVCADVCQQIRLGSLFIAGVMIESFLVEGQQSLNSPKTLIYGKSITDGCLGWSESKILLEQLAEAVDSRF